MEFILDPEEEQLIEEVKEEAKKQAHEATQEEIMDQEDVTG